MYMLCFMTALYVIFLDLTIGFIPKVHHAHHDSEDNYQKIGRRIFRKPVSKSGQMLSCTFSYVPKRYWIYLAEKGE